MVNKVYENILTSLVSSVNMKALLFIFCVAYSVENYVSSKGLDEKFTWSRINYSPANRRVARSSHARDNIVFIDNGHEDYKDFSPEPYTFENNIPIGANRWKNKLFVTVPRRQLGIPSTLNYIEYNNTTHHNVKLIPYPDLRTNSLRPNSKKENFVSIYRIAVDACDRLWMVDTGILEVPRNRTTLKHQRLIIMDLNTDKIIKTYYFKDADLTPRTTLTMTVVDVTKDTCDDAYAYFPDLAGYGLVVYSLKTDTSWRIQHNYFYLEPTAGDLNIAGHKFQWTDGIFSIALSDIKDDLYRKAYFHSLVGNNLYSVSTKLLKDSNTGRSYNKNVFSVVGSKGPNSHSSASDIHKISGILFFGLVNQNAVGCWNTNKPFKKENIGIVHQDNEKMIYPSDLKVYQDELIVLTNSMPVFIYSKLNYDEINFRVWTANVYDVVRGTVCE